MDGSSSECVPRGTPTFALTLETSFFGSFETLRAFSESEIPPNRKRISLVGLIQNQRDYCRASVGKIRKALEVFIFQVVAPTLSTLSRPHEQIPP
jgi:hypothetical protein